MYVYSVTVALDRALESDWLNWMQQEHIPDVMATSYFERYQMHRIMDPVLDIAQVSYNVMYYIESVSQLDKYQKEEAPRLQKLHQERYGEQCVAFRSILKVV
jgi:hypothetical protein